MVKTGRRVLKPACMHNVITSPSQICMCSELHIIADADNYFAAVSRPSKKAEFSACLYMFNKNNQIKLLPYLRESWCYIGFDGMYSVVVQNVRK